MKHDVILLLADSLNNPLLASTSGFPAEMRNRGEFATERFHHDGCGLLRRFAIRETIAPAKSVELFGIFSNNLVR